MSTALASLAAAERATFLARNPRSRALSERAAQHLLFGVPLHWMTDWGTPFALHVAQARGARLTDVDGHELSDFCLGDTGAMFGHAPAPVARALVRQAGEGYTAMLASEDAAVVGERLAERFGLPHWQFAMSATDANRFVLRWLRAASGRTKLVVFDGCYHGTVDDVFVDLVDGRPAVRASLLGQVHDLTAHTRVVPFNDLAALEAALAPGDVACVLAEPAMTNIGMVLPAPGFWAAAQALIRQHGAALVLDETHTISCGPGGYTRAHGLQPDALVLGKPVGGGVPCAVYGFSAEWAERAMRAKRAAPPGHSGIGTTLSGNLLAMAAMRATLDELMTEAVYAPMLARAGRLADGLRAVIARHGLPWCVTQLGVRAEFQFRTTPPRNGAEAAVAFDDALEHLIHLALLNRGVLITPFHNMLLVCPATTDEDVQRLLGALDEVLAWCSTDPARLAPSLDRTVVSDPSISGIPSRNVNEPPKEGGSDRIALTIGYAIVTSRCRKCEYQPPASGSLFRTEQIVLQRPRQIGRLSSWAAGALMALTSLFSPSSEAQTTAPTFLIGGVAYTSTPCAAEWGTCRFTGTRRVAYGVGNKWLFRYATGSQDCRSPAFGKDPAFGKKKACYTTASTVLIPPTTPNPAPLTTAQKQAARLLNQATWGATATEIARVSAMTPTAWVNEQLAKPLTTPSHFDYVAMKGPLGTSEHINAFMESFWSQAATGSDQLRQRMTFALSEIFVTSAVNSGLDTDAAAHAAYHDLLARNAFGNYRQLLEEVSLSPAMGIYLSHMNNQKEDTRTGRLPDENYAREVMQLFSIGLWQLNQDGSRKLDASGNPIPTYGIPEVMGMAKVFTGWTFNGVRAWNAPMMNNPAITSTSQKDIIDGVVIPAGTNGPASLKIALDTLANHPNVAPFMSEQLIKRFVTSNPSRAYVGRIAAVWANNGKGVRGDLGAVIKAILLDTEARSDTKLTDSTYGKLREPMLRFGHWLRAFNATPNDGVWTIWNLEDPVTSLGQNPQRSPSVFNYFRPDYAPPGPILAAGLTAPEFQITHETTLTGYSNFMSYASERGFGGKILPKYAAYEAIADNAETLLSRLNIELMAGQMSDGMKQTITNVMNTLPVTLPNARKLRVWQAVFLVMTSPEYVVQR